MNLLVLCTYPINNPRHGGQLRVRNIVDTYRAAGHEVEVVGVLGSENYEHEEGFLPFPGVSQLAKVVPNPFLMEDYALGLLFANDDQSYARLAAAINKRPDVIHVEQPWLLAFARRYTSTQARDAKVVYGSQNIEWRLKQNILSSYFDVDTAWMNAELVKKVELDAISGAEAIVCVSENDAEWVRLQTETPVVLAPNGVKAWSTTDEGRKEAADITQGYRYALYCASAHPPNMTGFFDMFGGGFGSLKPDEKLVVAGGAGWAIAGDVRVHQSSKLAEKVVVAGMVSQPCLEGLLDGAHCIVLPLTQGGGTNLKTAEALWSGRHIVATSVAMRGFESFIGSSGVHLADDSTTFKRALRVAMETEPLKLSAEEIDMRRTVLWESCLNPLLAFVANLTDEAVV
ncbi:glycosyltransferase family 4 protein [Rhodoferax sp.]|uniref:glycosyltransferase family 4 protein n=1 Tax=Rhodoferax sp. TaxID=50421 RepID=UPI0026327C83|nr:glycosyltransferase family 4 protein [Rhodoferax sp.]MDD3935651.1 glycosyltransferase family 4 protein [Rhodoferax sp.]